MTDDAQAGTDDRDALDLEARELCPDGSCVGVIGDDGRCRVCGRAGEGGAREASESPAPRFDEETGEATAGAEEEVAPEDGGDDRRLCPDGSCVGLIGPDGRCKVCGLAEDAAVD